MQSQHGDDHSERPRGALLPPQGAPHPLPAAPGWSVPPGMWVPVPGAGPGLPPVQSVPVQWVQLPVHAGPGGAPYVTAPIIGAPAYRVPARPTRKRRSPLMRFLLGPPKRRRPAGGLRPPAPPVRPAPPAPPSDGRRPPPPAGDRVAAPAPAPGKRSLVTTTLGLLAIVAGLAAVFVVATNGDDEAAGPAAPSAPTAATAAPPTTGAAPVAATVPELRISATEFAFDAPLEVAPGWVRLVMDNAGGLPHQASVYRLRDGVDGAALAEEFRTNRDAWIGKADPVGGPGGALTGRSQDAFLELTPGSYIVTCFLRGGAAAGQAHVMFGMSRTLEVTGSASGATPPSAAGMISLQDGAIVLPPDFTGRGTYHVMNEGQQPHEVSLLRLADGKTADDFTAFMAAAAAGTPPAGPPPFTNAGGFTPTGPGGAGFFSVELEPGSYIAADFIPDPDHNNEPHLMHGGLTPFEVTS